MSRLWKVIGPVRKAVHRAQMLGASLVSLRGSMPTALAPGHPYEDALDEARAYNEMRTREGPHGILDGARVLNFRIMLDLVAKLPAGDYAELGTFRGQTAKLIFERHAPGSTLYCFDTFEGFDSRDLTDGRLDNSAELAAFANTSVELVTNRIAGGANPELALRVGYFPETFAGLEDKRFRFVHIDMDLADPIRKGLETFWPRLVDGGMICVHDYYSARYPMSRETVDAFFAERGITVLGLSDRLGTGLVIKQPGMPV